jgi:hypothetical protein
MSQHDFSAIKLHYPATIRKMTNRFTAHEFIIKLAREHQKLYVEALHAYRNGNPFQIVHKQLAELLNEFPEVVRDGDAKDSHDIWTNQQGCSRWRRVQARASTNVSRIARRAVSNATA